MEENKNLENLEEEINLLDYYFIFKKRIWLLVFWVFISVGIALVYSLLSPKLYKSDATIMIPKEQVSQGFSVLSQLDLPISLPGLGSIADVYPAILKSRTLTRNVIKNLNLVKVLSHRKKQVPNKLLPEWKVIQLVQDTISVDKNAKDGIINISYIDKDPKLTAKIVNEFINQLKIFNQEKSLTVAKKQRIFIQKRVKVTAKKLNLAEENLKNFQTKNGVILPDRETEEKIKNIAALAAESEQTNIALNEAIQSKNEALKKLSEQTKTKISAKTITTNPLVEELKTELTKLQIQLADLSLTKKKEHPEVVNLQNQIKNVQERMKKEVENIIQSQQLTLNPIYEGLKQSIVQAEVEIAGLKARKSGLENVVNYLKPPIAKDVPKGFQYTRLLRELKIQEAIYTTLRQQLETAKIQESKEEVFFEVIDYAEPAQKKFKPKIKQNVLISATVGFMLGIFLIFLLEFIQNQKKIKRAFN